VVGREAYPGKAIPIAYIYKPLHRLNAEVFLEGLHTKRLMINRN
jgi:hypothetical protein